MVVRHRPEEFGRDQIGGKGKKLKMDKRREISNTNFSNHKPKHESGLDSLLDNCFEKLENGDIDYLKIIENILHPELEVTYVNYGFYKDKLSNYLKEKEKGIIKYN